MGPLSLVRAAPLGFAVVALAGLLSATGCAKNSPTPFTRDGGGTTVQRDSGNREDRSLCGALQEQCCFSAPRCDDGPDNAVCEGGTCCATPGGASCDNRNDCCADADCIDNVCCRQEGDRCDGSNDECCGELRCLSSGRCGRVECNYTACDDCLENGCGWCTDNNSCRAGDTDGPVGSFCDDTWLFGTNDVAECPSDSDCSASSCTTCLQAGNRCGWCGDSASGGSCKLGTTSGPDTGSCGSEWSWTNTDCSTLGGGGSCSGTSCSSCLSENGCGWCNSNGQCQSSRGSCSNYAEVPTQCGGSGECTDGNCQDCIHDNCGWCKSANACKSGTSGGSSDGTCTGSNWAWSSAACGGGGGCGSAGNCRDCNNLPGCSWCRDNNTCLSDDLKSTCRSGSSTYWWDDPADCCEAKNSSCDTCARATGCGWCNTNYTCREGASGGSEDGTCSGTGNWYYSYTTCPADTSNCNGATNCAECNQRSNCGWCTTTNRCLPDSQRTSMCSGSNAWDGSTSDCCSSRSCSVCNDISPCGWCRHSRTCMEGSITESDGIDPGGACSGSDWEWSGSCTQ